MSRTAANASTRACVKRTIISVNGNWFWKYVTGGPSAEHDCYVDGVLGNEHVSRLETLTHSYGVYGEKELILSRTKRRK